MSKNQSATTQDSKFGQSTTKKMKAVSSKPNKHIDVANETVRAGSPLNYVREKKRKTLKSSQTGDEDSSTKNSVIVMQPVEPISGEP